jgi:sialate O-acetylesterase
MKLINLLISFMLWFGSVTNAQQLSLAEIFNEGMVLQQKSDVLIWGNTQPNVPVEIIIQRKLFKAIADKNGKWEVTLKNLKPGGPYSMNVKSANEKISLEQVFIGEVWIAAGQSNMAFTLNKSANGKSEIESAKNPNIRFVMVPVLNFEGDKVRGDMNWRTATTEYAGTMSAVAYYFAKQLQHKLKVPIGVICCYKGGTAAEVWMSREKLLNNPDHAPIVKNYEDYLHELGINKYQELVASYETELKSYQDSLKSGFTKVVRPVEPMGIKNYKRPYGLYNTMFKRIMPYTAKGVIWYQGEANAPRAEQYQTLFPALIDEWRTNLRNPELPFYFVQLSNYDHPAYGERPMWAELREAQFLTWKQVENTGMAVSIDVGDKLDIHPINKKPVGDRLASIALNQLYGYKVPFSGPVFKSVKFENNKAILSFNYVYSGLTADGQLNGFSICGADRNFIPAVAQIVGNQVVVYSDNVDNPVAVRYGWSNWTNANLKNKNGFPAVPFRTDDFELFSRGVLSTKYNYTSDSQLKVRYVANSGYFITTKNHKILIDALFAESYGVFETPQKDIMNDILNGVIPFDCVDFVFLTHYHKDHCSPLLMAKYLKKYPKARLVTNKPALVFIDGDQFGFVTYKNQFIELTPEMNGTIATFVDDVKITSHCLKHLSFIRNGVDLEEYMYNSAYTIETEGVKVFHSGDTDFNNLKNYLERNKHSIEQVDVALIYYDIINSTEDLSYIVSNIQPRKIILMHVPSKKKYEWEIKTNQLKQVFPEIFMLST